MADWGGSGGQMGVLRRMGGKEGWRVHCELAPYPGFFLPEGRASVLGGGCSGCCLCPTHVLLCTVGPGLPQPSTFPATG